MKWFFELFALIVISIVHVYIHSITVPPRPSVTRIPAYSTTGLLLRIRTEITESQFSVSD